MAISNHGLGGYKQVQRRCGTMELERARSLVDAERTHVQQLLADIGAARTDDHDAERDASYPAQPLAQLRSCYRTRGPLRSSRSPLRVLRKNGGRLASMASPMATTM